jgi:hypothetical protein
VGFGSPGDYAARKFPPPPRHDRCDAWNAFANDTATVRSMTTREYAKAVKG